MADEQTRVMGAATDAADVRGTTRQRADILRLQSTQEVAGEQRFANLLARTFENRRLLIAQPAMMIVGILVYRVLPDEPQNWALAAVFLAAIVACWVLRSRFLAGHISLLAAGVVVGACLLPLHGALFGTGMLRGSAFGAFEMHVDAIHSDDGSDARIIVSGIVRRDEGFTPPIRRARLFMPSEGRPDVGDTITGRVRFYAVPGPVMPDSYDSQFQSYFDGIGAFGSVIGPTETIATSQGWALTAAVSRLRFAIGARIDAALAGEADAIARALVIGDQGQIDDATRDKMASAGLAHVLAISGLHLTLVAGGVFAALRMGLALSQTASLRWDLKRVAALGGIATGLFYLSISGASVSAVRATIMLVLVFGAVLAGRRALTMRNVAIAALFVIVTDPASIFRPSFQLSFAAVVALVGTYETFRSSPTRERGPLLLFGRFLAGLALTSLIAGLATALFAAFHFQQIAPLGILGNLLAVPLLAFVVLPSAFVGVVTMPLGLDALFFTVTGWGIEQILTIADWVSGLSAGMTSAPPITPVALLLGGAALCWLAVGEGRWRFAGVIAALPLLALFGLAARPDMLIADSTQAVALRMHSEMRLVTGRDGTFAVRAWSEGLQEGIAPLSAVQRGDFCDEDACYFRTGDAIAVSIVTGRGAFFEDCRTADVVLTRMVAPAHCEQYATVIDRDDLLSGGVHWLRWRDDGVEIRPAIADLGRPWRIQPPDAD